MDYDRMQVDREGLTALYTFKGEVVGLVVNGKRVDFNFNMTFARKMTEIPEEKVSTDIILRKSTRDTRIRYVPFVEAA